METTLKATRPSWNNVNVVVLKKAFDLVADADWRAPVAKYVSLETLTAAGVTVETVKEAVAFYTATEATTLDITSGNQKEGKLLGYYVEAVGYRAGPAGP